MDSIYTIKLTNISPIFYYKIWYLKFEILSKFDCIYNINTFWIRMGLNYVTLNVVTF
jgi:hypothetical protein